MILIYAFSNRWGTNTSSRTMLALQEELKRYPDILYRKVYFNPKFLFNEYIHNKQYTAIVGIGDYNSTYDRIKIETLAANLYGRHSIIPNAPAEINLDIPLIDNLDTSIFCIGQKMGNSNCNLIAYQIQSYINQKTLTSYHLFFHLPNKTSSADNAKSIANLLITNRVLQ